MRIDARIVGDDVILRPQGHVIGLNGLIGQLMCESHYSRFVVDLRDVPVLDSEGLGTVVRAYMLVKRRNGSLRLVNPTERTTELLRIAKLSILLEGAEGDDKADVGSRLKPRKPLDRETVSLPEPDAWKQVTTVRGRTHAMPMVKFNDPDEDD